MKTLVLTTPYMRGADVATAQKQLAKNPFGSFYTGKIDSEFGPLTAGAAKTAKYWLGYPDKDITPTYGDVLRKLLTKTPDTLPLTYKVRRNIRLGQNTKTKAYNLAVSQIGTKESPAGTNQTPYGLWYGYNGVPWCAIFVTYCFVNSGSKIFARGINWAYVPYLWQAAVDGYKGLYITKTPQKGDVVTYTFGNEVNAHVGIFEGWENSSTFTAIEGNTGVGNDANGGEVMRRERNASLVKSFIRYPDGN